jgi:hypothetical protein
MAGYGDWDGNPEHAETSIAAFFESPVATTEFTDMIRDYLRIVDQMIARKPLPRAITLDDVVHAKMIFDVYITLKARRWYMGELATHQGTAAPIS